LELVTWQHKHTLIAESFRSLLTSILFSGKNGDRPRVLVLTSASPMEGKTTVASNLGIALAEIKRKVLIIDGDLRKPRMHEIFDLPNERGLKSLLYEHPLTADGLYQVVQETSIPGLFVLPSGTATENAANLLYSENLPLLLAKFKRDFDMVIIDTPPMLQMPDARIVGRRADAVILVTRAGHTTRDLALAANQRFAEDKTRVLGTILNDWDPNKTSHAEYGYGRRYHHHYEGS
jgi:receptor protein-tyrosine kinase